MHSSKATHGAAQSPNLDSASPLADAVPPVGGMPRVGAMPQGESDCGVSRQGLEIRSVEQHFAAVEAWIERAQIGSTCEAARNLPTLSVVIPVFNELRTIVQVIDSVSALPIDLEMIVVDDASTDGTTGLLTELAARRPRVTVIQHESNRGKGAALQSGFLRCRGEVVIVQDADLEYDPSDIPRVIAPILARLQDVVYGSRYLDPAARGDASRVHRWGNALLTTLSNLFTGQQLTDMETCYKAFRREVLESIRIEQNRFGFEPEITAKLSKQRIRIAEVPIRYSPRSRAEGKKIGWRDLVSTLYCIVRYRFG